MGKENTRHSTFSSIKQFGISKICSDWISRRMSIAIYIKIYTTISISNSVKKNIRNQKNLFNSRNGHCCLSREREREMYSIYYTYIQKLKKRIELSQFWAFFSQSAIHYYQCRNCISTIYMSICDVFLLVFNYQNSWTNLAVFTHFFALLSFSLFVIFGYFCVPQWYRCVHWISFQQIFISVFTWCHIDDAWDVIIMIIVRNCKMHHQNSFELFYFR